MSRFLKILENYRSILEQEGEEFPADSSEVSQEPSPQTQVSGNTDSAVDVISKTDLVNFLNSFKSFIEKLNLPDSSSFASVLDGATIDNALEKFKQITDEINPSSDSSASPVLSQSPTSEV
jgi:hypothetical protein